MAMDSRHLLTPFKRRSKSRNKNRSLLNGDWKPRNVYIKGLSAISTPTDEEHSVSSFSTNATMDNNIGPGRMLDKLYQHLGRKVEWGILRISIASLHPNKILHCLWDDAKFKHIQASSLSEIIAEIDRRKGSVVVAGLQSLVHQTQSNSIYRSAGALAALSSLGASSLHYTDFYLRVALVEPIFQKLEMHTKALDDSNTEKWLFLALLVEGQEYTEYMNDIRYELYEEIMLSLSRSVVEIIQLDQTSQNDHGSLLALCKSASFLYKISLLSPGKELAENIEYISEAAYLLSLFFLSHVNRTISAISNSHYDSLNKLAYCILCRCITRFDASVERILQLFSQPALLPLLCKVKSSFLVYRARNKGAKELLTRTYGYLNEIELTCNIDLHWLPRNSLSTSQSILKIPMKFAMLRSHRLLNSFDELRREAQEPQCYYKYFTPIWERMFAFDKDRWCYDILQRWHERAIEVNIFENDLTAEFLEARDNPHACPSGLHQDFDRWEDYLKRRAMRSAWGEYLRCNMDWDWDTGSCLKRLFEIERPLSPINDALETVQANGTLRDGDILQVKIGGARATMPEAIQVPYEDGFGRIQYKTFYPGPSTEGIASIGEAVEQPASHALSERLARTGSTPIRMTKRLRVEQETGTDDTRYRAVYAGESLENITFAPNESILDGPRKRAYSATFQDDDDGSLASASYNSVSEDSTNLFTTMAIEEGPVDDDPMDVDCSESENDQEHVPESQSSRIRDAEYAHFVRDIQDTEERGPIAEFEQSFKQYRDDDELSYADSTTTYYTALSHPCNESTEIID